MQSEPLRLGFAFTAKDSPELRARIHRDLETAWRRVREADPEAVGLFLTGGFSRGEGSARGARPLNDYDLVVVRRRPWPRAGHLYGRLGAELEDSLGLHVDLAPVSRQRLRLLRPSAFWFDLRHGGRVLAGEPALLDEVPAWDAAAVPSAEGARLLANRAVGLLDAIPDRGGAPDEGLARFQAAKAFLACAEAELIVAHQYHPLLAERRDRFLALAKSRDGLDALAEGVAWASAFKLDPDGPEGRADARERWAAARQAVLQTAARVMPAAGWGALAGYPDGARADVVEFAYASLRARRAAPLKASHLVRALGFRLLGAASWPEGGQDAPAVSRHVARAFRESAPADWFAARDLLMRLRARTLQ